jgi:hypothetical protein
MGSADVPAGGLRHLVDQEQRVGDVTDVDDVPELVPHPVRPSCPGIQNIQRSTATGDTSKRKNAIHFCGYGVTTTRTFQEVDEELAARVTHRLQQGTEHQRWVDCYNVQPNLPPVFKRHLF